MTITAKYREVGGGRILKFELEGEAALTRNIVLTDQLQALLFADNPPRSIPLTEDTLGILRVALGMLWNTLGEEAERMAASKAAAPVASSFSTGGDND